MKKLLPFLLLLLPFSLVAQSFTLTSNGFINTDDNSKDYIVLDFPKISKNDLYKTQLTYLSKQFASPKDVISTVENETITINTIHEGIDVKGYIKPFKMNYTLTYEFKDGKLRILAPSINKIYGFDGTNNLITVGIRGDNFNKTIFNDKGELKLEKVKKTIELVFSMWLVKAKIAVVTAKQDNW